MKEAFGQLLGEFSSSATTWWVMMLNNKREGKRRGGERGEDHVLQNDDMRAAKNVVDKAVSDTHYWVDANNARDYGKRMLAMCLEDTLYFGQYHRDRQAKKTLFKKQNGF